MAAIHAGFTVTVKCEYKLDNKNIKLKLKVHRD